MQRSKIMRKTTYNLTYLSEGYIIVDSVYKELNNLKVSSKIRSIVGSEGDCKPLSPERKDKDMRNLSCFNLDEDHIVDVLSSTQNSQIFLKSFHNHISKYYYFFVETTDFEKTVLAKAKKASVFLKSILMNKINKFFKLIKVFKKALSNIKVSKYKNKEIDSFYTIYPIGQNSKLNMLKLNSIGLKISSKVALVTSSLSDYVTKYKNQMLNLEEYAAFKINLSKKCFF